MPSFALKSTYSQYKEDTDAVASWLAKTARLCGYSGELFDQSKAEGIPKKKAKKKAKQQENAGPAPSGKKYLLVKTAAFTTLAKFIAACQNPVVVPPTTFTQTLNRAISLRRKFAQSIRLPQSLDKSHTHFVSVLEEVNTILSGTTGVPTDVGAPIEPLTNSFASLTVEEPSPHTLSGLTVDEAPADSEPEFKADQFDDPMEIYLAFKLLVEDVYEIRKAVQQIWAGFKIGRCRSIAAALATNTAIDFARRLEKDISGVLEKHGGFEKVYEDCTTAFSGSFGYDVGDRKLPEKHADFLIKIEPEALMYPTYQLFTGFLPAVQSNPRDVPVYKPGHFGKVDFSGDLNSKSTWELYQSQKALLMEVFGSMTALIRIAGMRRNHVIAEDELIRGLRIAIETRKVSLWNVLSAQLIVDIHLILGSHAFRPFRELQDIGRHISQTIEKTLAKSFPHPNWPASNNLFLKEIMELVQDHVMKDPINETLKKMGTPGLPSEHHYFKRNPIYCGLFLYMLQMRFSEAGIVYANAWGAVLYSRHLYNALKKESLLQAQWFDMDFLSALQPDTIAFRGKAPADRQSYHKRLSVMMGLSVSSFAKDARHNRNLKHSATGPSGLEDQAPLSRVFMHRYCEGSGRVDFTPEELKSILEKTVTYEKDEDSAEDDSWIPDEHTILTISKPGNKPSKDQMRNRAQNLRRLTIPELLEKLSLALMGESPEFYFDYLSMHLAAWSMLELTRRVCDQQLQQIYGTANYLEHEYQLPTVAGYLLLALQRAGRNPIDTCVDQNTGQVTSAVFAKVAETWNKLLPATRTGRLVLSILENPYGVNIEVEH